MKRLKVIHVMLFALAAVSLLIQPISVLANGDDNNGGNGSPDEGLVAETSFSVDDESYPFIYGRAWVSNLTYWSWGELGAACISSDHDAYAHHYYENLGFDIYWSYRLWVNDAPFQYESNPRYNTYLGEYDPETQPMPTDLDDNETLWVDLSDLHINVPRENNVYNMSAYTRIDAYYTIQGTTKKFSWKDSINSISFLHFPPP